MGNTLHFFRNKTYGKIDNHEKLILSKEDTLTRISNQLELSEQLQKRKFLNIRILLSLIISFIMIILLAFSLHIFFFNIWVTNIDNDTTFSKISKVMAEKFEFNYGLYGPNETSILTFDSNTNDLEINKEGTNSVYINSIIKTECFDHSIHDNDTNNNFNFTTSISKLVKANINEKNEKSDLFELKDNKFFVNNNELNLLLFNSIKDLLWLQIAWTCEIFPDLGIPECSCSTGDLKCLCETSLFFKEKTFICN
jgi:hypothetical protein